MESKSTEEASLLHSADRENVAQLTSVNKKVFITLDTLLNYAGLGKFHIIVFLIACGGYFSYCCEIMLYLFLSAKLPTLWHLSNIEFAILPASSSFLNIVAGWIVGSLSDHIGRKWPFALCTALIGTFGLGAAFAQNFWVFIAVRSFVSLGIGGSCSCVFPFFVEFLPVKNRGKAMSLMALCGALGACSAGGVAWWLIPGYPVEGWRYLTIACALPNIFIAALLIVFPYDTPQYLLQAGKHARLKKLLKSLFRWNGKNFSKDFKRDLDAVMISRNQQQQEAKENSTPTKTRTKNQKCWKYLDFAPCRIVRLFARPHLFKTLVLTVLWLCLASGYWGSSLFIPQYFRRVGVDPYFTVFVSFAAELPGIALLSIIIDWPRIGRINAIRIYSGMTAVFMIVFTFVENLVVVSVFSVLVYFSMVPIYAVMYTYVPEVYPTHLRTTAVGYSVFASSVPNLVTPFVSGYLATLPTVWVYPLVWSCVFTVMFLASLFLRQETAGRNLS